jgi:hypothetical protein
VLEVIIEMKSDIHVKFYCVCANGIIVKYITIKYIKNTRASFLNNQQDTLIIQIYSVIKLYIFRASSLPIIRSFILYIRHWMEHPDSAWKRSSKPA